MVPEDSEQYVTPLEIQKQGVGYVSDLADWASKAGVSPEHMYSNEFIEDPAVGFFLMGQVGLVREGSYSLRFFVMGVFMAGMLVGVRQAREGRLKPHDDAERRYAEAADRINNESRQRQQRLADRYFDRMLADEEKLGFTRGVLANREAERDDRLHAFTHMAAVNFQDSLNEEEDDITCEYQLRSVLSVFKAGLMAGARVSEVVPEPVAFSWSEPPR